MASVWAKSEGSLDLHLDFDPDAADGRRAALELALRSAIREYWSSRRPRLAASGSPGCGRAGTTVTRGPETS